jgi:hypothetical protein
MYNLALLRKVFKTVQAVILLGKLFQLAAALDKKHRLSDARLKTVWLILLAAVAREQRDWVLDSMVKALNVSSGSKCRQLKTTVTLDNKT